MFCTTVGHGKIEKKNHGKIEKKITNGELIPSLLSPTAALFQSTESMGAASTRTQR